MKRTMIITVAAVAGLLLAAPVFAHGPGGSALPGMGGSQMGAMMGSGTGPSSPRGHRMGVESGPGQSQHGQTMQEHMAAGVGPGNGHLEGCPYAPGDAQEQ